MKIFSIVPILTIVYGAITMIDECPSVPLGCRCSHKKKGFTISCENLKFVSLAMLPTNISMDIDLEGNYLQFVNESSFPHPNKIRRLNLKNCGIETLGSRTFYGFLSLKKLDLSRNYLTQISENVFQGLEKTELTVIDLRSNYILSISQRAFENVATELLDLSGQKNYRGKKAELIAYNDFLRLSKVKKLSLDDNQLLCDCNIKWLGNWLGKGRQLSEETRCHYPEQLRGKLLGNLFNSSWNCGDYQESFSLPNFRLVPLTNQIGFENDAIQFSCYSTWILKSYIRWIKNGKELLPDKSNKRIEIRNHFNLTLATYTSILLIHRLHLTDSGKITCQLIVYGSGNVTSTANLFVISENNPKCKPSITTAEQGSVMWPTAYFNTTIRTKCPYDGFSTAERSCGNGTWENFSMESCFFGDPTTKALQSFYMNAKSADNLKAVVAVCNQFNSFLRQKYKYIKSKFDFYYISRMLFYIMHSSRILDRSQYANFIWGSIGLIVIKYKELPSLEERVYDYSALWRFQQLLELFLYEESLKKLWSFSIENHPTMAAHSYKIKAKNLVLCYVGSQILINEEKAIKICCSIERNITMEQNADVSISLIVPTATVQLSIITFAKNTFFPLHGNYKIISSVVGIHVYNTSTHQQTLENYQITFHFQKIDYTKPQIVIWDKDESQWKQSPACSKLNQISTNLTQYKCFLNNLDKMIYFALSAEIPAILTMKSQYLEVVIYFGAALSTTLLLLTLVIYCVFRELRFSRNDAAAIMNLILSLIIAQISFSCGIHRTNTEFLCKGVALTLHYFLLCSLLWLGCGSFMLLKMLKNKDRRKIKDSVLKYYLISWGLPLIICSVTIAYDHKKYKAEQFCWLAPNISIGAFVCPASLFLLCDFVVLCYLHAIINKIYPVLNEVAEENLSSVGQSKLSLKVRKDKKVPALEYDFPKRDELMSLLHGNLLVLLFFCLLIVFTKMIFIYKDTASGYLYYVFSYASAFCNLFLGLVTVCFYCLPRKDIRTKIKNIVSCFHQRTKIEETVNLKSSNFGESFETNDKSIELLDTVSETHGVFGLSDIVCSEASYPTAAAVGSEQQSTYEMQSDLLTCKSKLHTILISTNNKEFENTKAANQGLQKPNQALSEISGHNSIGECSLSSKRGHKSNAKNPDIPENLRHFVPENWRPVRRRVKKGTSFYPYLNTDNSAKSSSMVHGSNTSSVTSTNIAAIPLHINKKQAAKNLAMYNDLFNKPKMMYEPYPTSNGSSFPNTPNSFHNTYNHFNNRTAEERLFSPNLLTPTLFPIQYNNAENTQEACELISTHYNNKNPAIFLNAYHEATNNHEAQLFRENNLHFPENICSDTDNMRDSVEKKVKLASVQEILNDSAVNNDFLEEPLLKKVPILYIPLPHITKKQFELCAETKC